MLYFYYQFDSFGGYQSRRIQWVNMMGLPITASPAMAEINIAPIGSSGDQIQYATGLIQSLPSNL